MKRRTEIICTLGPVTREKEIILKLAKAGMSIARINFSHGDHAGHQKIIDNIREINQTHKCRIKILQDLEGYRIRIGTLEQPIDFVKNEYVWMSNSSDVKENVIPFQFDDDLSCIQSGVNIFINDGNLHLEVVENVKNVLKLKVLQGGLLSSHKGVNIPDIRLKANIMTEKDMKDLEFGIENKFDYIAQSFVRNKSDVVRIKKRVENRLPQCKFIAKIENKKGLRNLDSIIEASDGIMIARGDLGVSLPIYQIPILQKKSIRRCNNMKKFSITATQMLESMTENIRPTRAEVSDVANAVLDGSDFVMLSAETAVGKFPVETVKMMSQIIEYTESSYYQFM